MARKRHDTDDRRLREVKLRAGDLREFESAPRVGPRLRPGLTDHEWEQRKRARRQRDAPRLFCLLNACMDARQAVKRLSQEAEAFTERIDGLLGVRSGDLVAIGEDDSLFQRDHDIPADALGQRLMNLMLAVNRAVEILRDALARDAQGWPDNDGGEKSVDKAA